MLNWLRIFTFMVLLIPMQIQAGTLCTAVGAHLSFSGGFYYCTQAPLTGENYKRNVVTGTDFGGCSMNGQVRYSSNTLQGCVSGNWLDLTTYVTATACSGPGKLASKDGPYIPRVCDGSFWREPTTDFVICSVYGDINACNADLSCRWDPNAFPDKCLNVEYDPSCTTIGDAFQCANTYGCTWTTSCDYAF